MSQRRWPWSFPDLFCLKYLFKRRKNVGQHSSVDSFVPSMLRLRFESRTHHPCSFYIIIDTIYYCHSFAKVMIIEHKRKKTRKASSFSSTQNNFYSPETQQLFWRRKEDDEGERDNDGPDDADDVKGVLFRRFVVVDVIWRAVLWTRRTDKNVIVRKGQRHRRLQGLKSHTKML